MPELIEALYYTSFHDSGDCYFVSSTINNMEAEGDILNVALTILPLLLIKHNNVHTPSPYFNVVKIGLAYSLIILVPEANAERPASWTPLHDFATGKPQRLPLEILAKRYDINIQDAWGSTPAYIASKHNSVSALQKLIELGADLTIADKNGYLPLHIACYYGNNEIIKLMHERGVSLEIQNAHKQDCIDLVFLARDEEKITVEVEKDILAFINSRAHKEL